MAMSAISPQELHARLRARDGEMIVLDVRENGVFGADHLLFAANAPLSRLEIDLPRMVPRRTTDVILCDDGDDLAKTAQSLMAAFGYENVAVLDGGLAAWKTAGLETFSGVYVPSKAFGEYVEAECDTPRVTAQELAALKANGTDMVILDSRPFKEYHRMNIPDGINVPGAELVHRVKDLAPNPDTLVVVNCAGRTRSIIGAQSLINANVPNRVVALENGTMGWHLAGQSLAHGQTDTAPALSDTARTWAKAAAQSVSEKFAVPSIDLQTLEQWRTQRDQRTLYVCDVRSPEEYRTGHLTDALSTPGGQLVQSTDLYVPVLGARIVLVDDDGVRARMTGSWLVQMGRTDVFVLSDGMEGQDTASGDEIIEPLGLPDQKSVDYIKPDLLAGDIDAGRVVVLDFGDSRRYGLGHIPSALFIVRSRIATDLPDIPSDKTIVLTSADGVVATLAYETIKAMKQNPVRVLAGGTKAWKASGQDMEAGFTNMASVRNDLYLLPYDNEPGRIEESMRAYLNWETSLLPQIARDGTAQFDVGGAG